MIFCSGSRRSTVRTVHRLGYLVIGRQTNREIPSGLGVARAGSRSDPYNPDHPQAERGDLEDRIAPGISPALWLAPRRRHK